MKKIFLPLFLLVVNIGSFHILSAQSVAINTDGSAPNGSAMLDIKSTDKGVLVPRVALTSAVTTPVNGLLVYQTGGTAGFYYYNGTAWIYIQNSGNANITLQGNTFNAANQLVKLNASGQLPAVSGANLTNLPAKVDNMFGTALVGSSSTRYLSIFGNTVNANEDAVAVRFSVACTLSNLNISVIDQTTGNAVVQTAMTSGVLVNGSTALSCTTSSSSSCTSSSTVAIAAGDMVCFFVTGMNSFANAVVRFSARCQY